MFKTCNCCHFECSERIEWCESVELSSLLCFLGPEIKPLERVGSGGLPEACDVGGANSNNMPWQACGLKRFPSCFYRQSSWSTFDLCLDIHETSAPRQGPYVSSSSSCSSSSSQRKLVRTSVIQKTILKELK